ncbi:tetratricopeptide repeat-containing diguanylate cyclase [Natronospira bacteriovora]|uniref:diguanylate cyclase n=1 Tax=Natronospira bacteriovora TaxID=3069753 RepID=A0ABU0W7K4_9GAMM|nr:tetratricopeptide repeat-containing diguanylate cyclase [Natronospira sp. AB-CW4]MDQ2070016.1 diguanylate cyclase [Natronospira sp. AB-CW4]
MTPIQLPKALRFLLLILAIGFLTIPFIAGATEDSPAAARLSEAEGFVQSDPRRALALLDQALQAAEGDGEHLTTVRILHLRAEVLRDQGEVEQALLALDAAEGIAVRARADRLAIRTDFIRGTIHLDNADYDRALAINHAVLRRARAIDAPELVAGAYNTIGNIHFSLSQPERARGFYERAAEQYRALEFRDHLSAVLGNIGNTYNDEGNHQQALPYHLDSLGLARELGRETSVAYQNVNVCNTLVHLDRHEEARRFCQRGIEALEAVGHYRPLNFAYRLMGDLEQESGNLSAAIDYQYRALEIAREMDSPALLEASYQNLSELHEALGDYPQALAYARRHFDVHTRVMSSERQQTIVELEQAYEADQRRSEIERLELDAELREMTLRQRQMLTLVGFGLFIVTALLAILIWRGYRTRKRIGERFQQKNRELREALKTISRLARQDPLTGLSNRRRLMEVVKAELARRSRTGSPIAVSLGDIDYFKQINDEHGHHIGDQILVALGRRIRSCLRENDLLCRWGGEEFLVLMPETDVNAARKAMEKVCAAVSAKPFETDAGPIDVTITFGVAELMGDDFKEAVRTADRAMYTGKHQGRNRVMVIVGE